MTLWRVDLETLRAEVERVQREGGPVSLSPGLVRHMARELELLRLVEEGQQLPKFSEDVGLVVQAGDRADRALSELNGGLPLEGLAVPVPEP